MDERRAGGAAATDAATAAGYVLGAELRACGVDLSFTPVLDLDFGASGVIGDRAFHRDPRVVTLLAKSLMHGLLLAGMANCGKHFPGHGFVRPTATPTAPVDPAQPQGDPGRRCPALRMAEHQPGERDAGARDLPEGRRAAGRLLERWLKDILRLQLGFTGAIFSDDLSMAGARRINGAPVSFSDAAAVALNAGCDLVLLCNQSLNGGRAVDELLDGLAEAEHQGHWHRDPDSEARRLDLLPQTAPFTWDELMHLPAYQRALERLP